MKLVLELPDDVVKYVFESTLPSAFRNWLEVPPDLIKFVAVTVDENVAALVENDNLDTQNWLSIKFNLFSDSDTFTLQLLDEFEKNKSFVSCKLNLVAVIVPNDGEFVVDSL